MAKLFQNNDGADFQAQAVLAHIRMRCAINGSSGGEPEVHRWHNCREQGYVIMVHDSDYSRQFNIAFFEHRNSDSVHAVAWEQRTMNPPTIDTADFGDVYKDKYDTSHSVAYGKSEEMAAWIIDKLEEFLKTK